MGCFTNCNKRNVCAKNSKFGLKYPIICHHVDLFEKKNESADLNQNEKVYIS